MKLFSYYSTHKFQYPKKADYTTYFAYDEGKCIYQGSDKSAKELKSAYPGAVIQEVLDKDTHKKHLDEYINEGNRLLKEFQDDLFEEFGVSDNPKRYKCYNLAYERGHSSGYGEIYNEFSDLVELIIDN